MLLKSVLCQPLSVSRPHLRKCSGEEVTELAIEEMEKTARRAAAKKFRGAIYLATAMIISLLFLLWYLVTFIPTSAQSF